MLRNNTSARVASLKPQPELDALCLVFCRVVCVLTVSSSPAATGGRHQVRGEHGPQLPLPLAGVGRLHLRTLPEVGRAVPAKGEVKSRRHTEDSDQ